MTVTVVVRESFCNRLPEAGADGTSKSAMSAFFAGDVEAAPASARPATTAAFRGTCARVERRRIALFLATRARPKKFCHPERVRESKDLILPSVAGVMSRALPSSRDPESSLRSLDCARDGRKEGARAEVGVRGAAARAVDLLLIAPGKSGRCAP